MEDFISTIYGFLANILLFVTEFSRDIAKSMGALAPFIVGSCFIVAALVCLILAIKKNDERYNFFVKAAVGGSLFLIVTHHAILYLEGLDVIQTVPFYSSPALLILVIGVLAFAAVNYHLENTKGTITLLVWGAEFLFAAGAITFWECMKGADGTLQYENLLFAANIVKPFTVFVNELGFQTIVGILEYILLMFLLFGTVFFVCRVWMFMCEEWSWCLAGQLMVGIAYLLYAVHDDYTWRMDQAFLVFLLFCAGWMLNFIMFFYELRIKNQEGCVGAFFMAVAGVLWSCAVVLAADIAKQGGLRTTLKGISSLMTKVYRMIPVGIHTNFNQGNWIMALLGIGIAMILAAIIVVLLFFVLSRVLVYDAMETGMDVYWFRNCSMFLLLSIVLYWGCSTYGTLVLTQYPWIDLAAQSLAGIALALCFSNIAPALRMGFAQQLKLILISTLTTVLFGILLVPALLALI